MNIVQVKNDINNRKVPPLYIFTGEEIGVMDIYINQIAKVLNQKVVRLDTFREVFGKLKVSPILEKSELYIIQDDGEILENEKIMELLNNPLWAGKNTVILVFTKLDKRSKFYKRYKDIICEFEPLEENVLTKYIKKEISLSDRNCRKLIAICESNYSRIMLEVDKLKSYRDGIKNFFNHDRDFDDIFELFLDDDVIYQPAQDSIFLWSDTILNRDRKEAFKLADKCFQSGEAVLTMLTVLYTNLKKVLQVQACESKEVGNETGLTGWEIYGAKKFVNNFDISELLDAMDFIRQMEVGIKTGKIEEAIVIPYVLVNML